MSTEDYEHKYQKYKQKYNELKQVEARLIKEGKLNADGSLKQQGGAPVNVQLYKAEWCGHCKHFSPVWDQLQQSNKHVKFETFDADKHKEVIASSNIQGFPTIRVNGHDYKGSRDFNSLHSLLNSSE